MARVTEQVILALRRTADRIVNSAGYQWGHMGACNCGHLAQEITQHNKAEIHNRAMYGNGDWNDQLNDYCGISKQPFDEVIAEMLDFGFDPDDLKHLEKLSDKKILKRLPYKQPLKHNVKEDVALYITLWANLLTEELEARNLRMARLGVQPENTAEILNLGVLETA
jgi:hypothetical protein